MKVSSQQNNDTKLIFPCILKRSEDNITQQNKSELKCLFGAITTGTGEQGPNKLDNDLI